MKLEPLSVVCTVLSWMLLSVFISFRASARAENICDPLRNPHARAAEHLSIVSGSIKQSVVVAMSSVSLMAAFTFVFISSVAFSPLFFAVLW